MLVSRYEEKALVQRYFAEYLRLHLSFSLNCRPIPSKMKKMNVTFSIFQSYNYLVKVLGYYLQKIFIQRVVIQIKERFM